MSDSADSKRHHTVDYVEFTVIDLDAAKRFYAAAFGWSFKDYGPGYSGIVGAEKEMGGLAQGVPTVGVGVLVVLYSADLDSTASPVEKAGGTIVTAIFEFPGGRRFHFADPSGNEVAVWTTTE